mmetsp:Transcript_41293/g.132791  ORF Transcript_41293/g.132791 Transcript_41293/m.132791 type:complete len:238 (+) Transcript_41293:513-1226(+)
MPRKRPVFVSLIEHAGNLVRRTCRKPMVISTAASLPEGPAPSSMTISSSLGYSRWVKRCPRQSKPAQTEVLRCSAVSSGSLAGSASGVKPSMKSVSDRSDGWPDSTSSPLCTLEPSVSDSDSSTGDSATALIVASVALICAQLEWRRVVSCRKLRRRPVLARALTPRELTPRQPDTSKEVRRESGPSLAAAMARSEASLSQEKSCALIARSERNGASRLVMSAKSASSDTSACGCFA